MLESYAKFAKHGEKIGRYRVEGHGSTFYSQENLIDLPTQDRVVAFLRDPQRVFALVAASELAPLDSAFKQAQAPTTSSTASSSRFLLLTNQLDPGQRDQNPLIKDVWMPPAGAPPPTPSPPGAGASPISATFENAIELVGADFPAEVRRPGKIPLDLIFKVKAKPPGGYKIFVHFDGPAAPRVIGDHDPVNHAFGTTYWLPGEYVRDHSETDVPLMTTPAGTLHRLHGLLARRRGEAAQDHRRPERRPGSRSPRHAGDQVVREPSTGSALRGSSRGIQRTP